MHSKKEHSSARGRFGKTVTRGDISRIVHSFIRENYLFDSKKKLVDDESFLDSGVMDSTGILELVSFLEERFKIVFRGDELVGDNFDSISRVSGFLLKKLQQTKE